ncbi:hypothetical protein B7494_g4543 [Chlorociboria aeruginascens]|nr:hypothetical protein B7494_g4543 [Chlorociboria aeruginascens]
MNASARSKDKGRESTYDADTPKPRLTFGVELEFVVLTLNHEDHDPHEDDPRNPYGIDTVTYDEDGTKIDSERSVRRHIAATLTKAGVQAFVEDDEDEIRRLGFDRTWTFCWQTTDDMTVNSRVGEGYRGYSVELNSPPYYFQQSAIEAVQQVCGLLTSNYRIICNDSCGLHVHVGNSNEGFDTDTLKLLVACLWTFEPQINQIHPAHRTNNKWCRSFRMSSELSTAVFDTNDMDSVPIEERGLEIILGSNTLQNVIELARPIDRACRIRYNVSRGLETGVGKRTIEYRQGAATLDLQTISNWIWVCVGFVFYADNSDPAVVESFLRKHINDKPANFNIVDVLKGIGLPAQAQFYSSRLTHHAPEIV